MIIKPKISKREIEETVVWLLTHKQKEVQAVLRKFRKLAPNKQRMLDKKLVYLASILDHSLKGKKARTRCKSCGHPMHVKWFGCQNPIADAGHLAQERESAKTKITKAKKR
jgi:hypothetical protein